MVSAVILTKNEENNIVDCLETLSWCGEILVIDDYSEDRTVEIAKKLGAKVYQHSLEENFSVQRNFGLEKAIGDWVFFVDADERVPSSLCSEILQITNKQINKYNGFYLKRRDILWGKVLQHGEVGDIKLLRLAKKGKGKWQGLVHEAWDIQKPLASLRNQLFHNPHPTIREFLKEINLYTDIRSKELYEQGIRANFLTIALYTKAKFIQNYFFKLGFLDGNAGLVHAMLMSFHSFLVRGKLWLLWHKK